MKNKPFENIIGQEAAKKQLNFYLESYQTTKLIPNLIVVAPKGNGKTTISREIAKGLYKYDDQGKLEYKEDGITPRKKSFVEVNCATIKTPKQLVIGLLQPYVVDKHCTVFFDEAGALSNGVTNALLTMLNPTPSNKTTFSYDEYVVDIDFTKQSFVFATSEINAVFPPLVDRLKRIDLADYTVSDIAEIIQLGTKDIRFDDKVLPDIASVTRGNARNAQMMATDLLMYLKTRKVFNRKDWNIFKDIMGIKPLGLSPLEIGVLRIIGRKIDGTSLTSLSAQSGMSRESLQQSIELYLLKNGLINIETGGRVLTQKGQQYLKDI